MGETTSLSEAMGHLDTAVFCMARARIKVRDAVELFRAHYVRAAVASKNGHKGRAAVEFGIHRNTLRRYLEKK